MQERVYKYAVDVIVGNLTIDEVPIRFREATSTLLESEDKILSYVQDKKWAEIKAMRDKLEESGCPYKDKVLDSDARSTIKLNMMIEAAKQVGESFTINWTMQDNTVLTLTYEDVALIPLALANYSNQLHEQARVYRDQIYTATTIADVMAITWQVD